jgi:hypothetical protein
MREIDYDRMKKTVRRQRAELTRAVNSGDRAKVLEACSKAVREWNEPGMSWPDGWSRWQSALNDMYPVFSAPRLEDLDRLD